MRRTAADSFHAAIDWSSVEQCQRYLQVVERVLDDHDNDTNRSTWDRLTQQLKRAGIQAGPDGRLRLPPRRVVA